MWNDFVRWGMMSLYYVCTCCIFLKKEKERKKEQKKEKKRKRNSQNGDCIRGIYKWKREHCRVYKQGRETERVFKGRLLHTTLRKTVKEVERHQNFSQTTLAQSYLPYWFFFL